MQRQGQKQSQQLHSAVCCARRRRPAKTERREANAQQNSAVRGEPEAANSSESSGQEGK